MNKRHLIRSTEPDQATRDSARSCNAGELDPIVTPVDSVPHREILHILAARPAELGGLLLGPRHGRTITLFHYDATAACTGTTYTPDHESLNRLFREVWAPGHIVLRGVAHSHPEGVHELSEGDLDYIGRILEHNPHLPEFHAPLVIPTLFRIIPWVVRRHRDGGLEVRRATLLVVDGDAQAKEQP